MRHDVLETSLSSNRNEEKDFRVREVYYSEAREKPRRKGRQFPFLAVAVFFSCLAIINSCQGSLSLQHARSMLIGDMFLLPAPIRGIFCKYDGHCPVGSTCSASSVSYLGGICEPVSGTNASHSNMPAVVVEQCAAVCQKELEWDESFYFKAAVEPQYIQTVQASNGRPAGCLLTYERKLGASIPNLKKRPEWIQTRSAKRIVRVDPSPTEKDVTGRPLWRAFCYNPCQSDDDCSTQQPRGAFTCNQGACQRRREYWNKTDDPTYHDTVIVTGANGHYFRGLRNFVASARYWAPKNRVVVFNLGMSETQLEAIDKWPNVVDIKWREGFPEHFPPHTRIAKVYAWKSLAINESVHEYQNIFWLDAGATWTGPITAAEDIIQSRGILLVQGQDSDMKNKAHSLTYKWFNESKESFLGGPHYAGGIQGHLFPSRYIDTIVKPNAECAMDASCIRPEGSSTANHRYDQTTLSILAHQPETQVPPNTELIAATRNQLNRNMSLPSGHTLLWTARQGTQYYYELLADEFPEVVSNDTKRG